MIAGIQLIQSIGQFDHVPGSAITLSRFVLMYAENGRGKTTFSAVLRSLSNADPEPIVERSRFGAATAPHAVLRCTTGPSQAVFENGAWSRDFAGLAVFDELYIDQNLYSGIQVESQHRRNLHDLILGAHGVALNRTHREAIARIQQHNSTLRDRLAALTPAIRGPYSVDQFCALQETDIQPEIERLQRELATSENAATIRAAALFISVSIPSFDVDEIQRTLSLEFRDLDQAAVQQVQSHFQELGRGGEVWVSDGMRRIHTGTNGTEHCPFCAQSLDGSELVSLYRSYFGDAYRTLVSTVTSSIGNFDRTYPENAVTQIERSLRTAGDRQAFWSRFVETPNLEIDTRPIGDLWLRVRQGLRACLISKTDAPLSRVEIPARVTDDLAALRERLGALDTLNSELEAANSRIRAVQQNAGADEPATLRARLAELEARSRRRQPEVAALCQAYLSEQSAKTQTEETRDRSRDDLGQYRRSEFPQYQERINRYLERFGAEFRLEDVRHFDHGTGSACNYEIRIRNVRVPVAGGDPQPGQPSFRNTLSAGDRSSLAFSFFLSQLDRDPDIASKVVVIDDPIASLDEHRSLATVQEIRSLGDRVSRVVVLSHDRAFLSQLWLLLEATDKTSLQIVRDGDSSNITSWDVESYLRGIHAQNHDLICSYLEQGNRINNRHVAVALRLVLEAFLKTAYPSHYSIGSNAMGSFRNICRQRVGTDRQILSETDLGELDNLVGYANLFHHDTNPATYSTVSINDTQLAGYARRVIRFAARP